MRKARALEDAFFYEEDQKKIALLRRGRPAEAPPAALAGVSGLTDPLVLGALGRLGIGPAAASGLILVPVVEAAWADGPADALERRLVTEVLGPVLGLDEVDQAVLGVWLGRRPGPGLMDSWEGLVRHLVLGMSDPEAEALGRSIVPVVDLVLGEIGGFLGFEGFGPGGEALLVRIRSALT